MIRSASVLVLLLATAAAAAAEPALPQGVRQRLQPPPKKAPGSGPTVAFLAWTLDGRTLYAGNSDAVISVWDAATGKSLRTWRANSNPDLRQMGLSPDGRKLITTGPLITTNLLWDATTGRQIAALDGTHINARFAFTPDSKAMVGFAQTGLPPGASEGLFLWSAATGKKLSKVQGAHPGTPLRLSPDGKTLATADHRRGVWLFDLAAGKELYLLKQPECELLAFAPDGQRLAVAGGHTSIRLWDPAKGSEVREIKPGRGRPVDLAFSARGAWLAAPCTDRAVHIWDVDTGGEVACLNQHKEFVQSVAFSPDGRTLATGGHGEILLWDVPTILAGRADRVPPVADEKARQALWNDLASPNAVKAYRALWNLAPAGTPAVELVARHVQPAAAVDAAQAARWIADLASSNGPVGDRASQELAKLEDRVEGALREARKSTRSAAARRRLDHLLQRLDETPSPGMLLAERVPLLLEQVGTPAAKKELQRLAAGADSARLTRAARAALERMKP